MTNVLAVGNSPLAKSRRNKLGILTISDLGSNKDAVAADFATSFGMFGCAGTPISIEHVQHLKAVSKAERLAEVLAGKKATAATSPTATRSHRRRRTERSLEESPKKLSYEEKTMVAALERSQAANLANTKAASIQPSWPCDSMEFPTHINRSALDCMGTCMLSRNRLATARLSARGQPAGSADIRAATASPTSSGARKRRMPSIVPDLMDLVGHLPPEEAPRAEPPSPSSMIEQLETMRLRRSASVPAVSAAMARPRNLNGNIWPTTAKPL
eukprot:gnl/TRDRNA2_/TRDRNA2_191862_c0_seq1.p1 gnl/TRDRNA2_/TRDRNA2_191862_c0~~gnl/TRDRNA2_/TRDRNA2_191862_c0_seq1.p1  ORF type:complete len:272 (+),score=36.64 gnl/TRDRNA2_/TRDRNA2_191862_c0_seq1:98-913(+)